MKKVILLILLSLFFYTTLFAETQKEIFDNGVLFFKQGQYNYKGVNAQAWAAMSLFLQYLRYTDFSYIQLEASQFEDFNLVFNDGRKIVCESKDWRRNFSFADLKKVLKSILKKNVLGEKDKGLDIVEYLLQYGSVLKAAEMSGGVQTALEIAVKYAKERYQFGKPIGSFQSLQHRLVKMLTEVDGLKNLVYEAAWNFSTGNPDKMLNSMVKVKANNAYHRVSYDAVYIHGAIGWTEEMDISLYLLRAKANENDCGGTDFHKERIALELEKYEPDFLSLR